TATPWLGCANRSPSHEPGARPPRTRAGNPEASRRVRPTPTADRRAPRPSTPRHARPVLAAPGRRTRRGGRGRGPYLVAGLAREPVARTGRRSDWAGRPGEPGGRRRTIDGGLSGGVRRIARSLGRPARHPRGPVRRCGAGGGRRVV